MLSTHAYCVMLNLTVCTNMAIIPLQVTQYETLQRYSSPLISILTITSLHHLMWISLMWSFESSFLCMCVSCTKFGSYTVGELCEEGISEETVHWIIIQYYFLRVVYFSIQCTSWEFQFDFCRIGMHTVMVFGYLCF